MTSLPLDSTHSRNTSGVECHHRLWTAHPVRRRRACHAIIAFGQHTRLNDVRHGMPSSPLDSTHGRTTSDVACHHRIWAAHTVERRQAWHAVITFRQHKRSNDAGRGMKSPPLNCTHARTTSGVECHHHLWAAQTVERCWAWHEITLLDCTDGQTTSGVA